ncbi:MAG: PaaI family thioesterase [Rhodospirillaceae bacterium]|jgi:uncharacterized protein (TIGR00369 family)|nr:PaaI family thioesterase [Rhodospirillaceae bacterium]
MEPRFAGYADRVREVARAQGFLDHLAVEVVLVEPGAVDLALSPGPEHAQQHGYVHGGAIATLCDSSCGLAALTLAGSEESALTIEFKVDFLRPARTGRLIARGRVVKPGRRISVMETNVYEQDAGERDGGREIHVARGSATYAILPEGG